MTEIARITPEKVRPKVKAGEALLVCAYDSEETFRKMRLEGAISLDEFKENLPDITEAKEIVFYCA